MKEIDDLLDKIEKFALSKSNLDEFISHIDNNLKSISNGNITKEKLIIDQIEWLKVISFILHIFENDKNQFFGDDWRKEKIEFQKLKNIIDDLKFSGILSNCIWGIGGNCFFQIVEKHKFLQFLYKKIIFSLKNIPIEKQKKDDQKDEIIKPSIFKFDESSETPTMQFLQPQKPKVFNTNLKHIEKELEETVNKISYFNKTQKEIEKWVSQFKKDNERKYALKLLNNFRYYDDEAMIDFYNQAHKNLLFEFNDEPKISDFLFIPAGGASSSGSRCTPDYRIYNNLKESQTINPTELENLKKDEFKYIVFIDDFIGTGNQANTFFNKIDFKRLKDNGIEKIFYVILVGFKEGIENIESNNENIKVISVEILDDRDKVFSKKSKIFSKDEIDEAKAIFIKYAKNALSFSFIYHPLHHLN